MALWPLEDGNLRCAIDPRNDLTANSVGYAEQTVGWNLPPNADSNVTDAVNYLFDPVNRGEMRLTEKRSYADGKSEHLYDLFSTAAGRNFTLEGYFMLTALHPEGSTTTKIIANVSGGTANPNGGWSLNYYTGLTDGTKHVFCLVGNGWQRNFDPIPDAAVVGLTNGWNHFAVVFSYQSQTNPDSSDWTFYLNGTPYGTVNRRMATFTPNWLHPAIRIGHHLTANDDRTAYGRYCYWRLSDEALLPSQFLNYDPEHKGGALVPEPTPAGPERTVAYWKFNAQDGVADVLDYVGDAHLVAAHGGNRGFTTAAALLVPSEESAFDGNPPNPTVTFPSGNHGSFRCPTTRLGNICVTNGLLGAQLDVTNAFTVEGWFKPERRTGTEFNASQQIMFSNMSLVSYRGWAFGLMTAANGRRRLRILAYNRVGGESQSLVPSTDAESAFCDVTDWGEEWRHVALTYDPAGGASGFGRWTVYMNGVLQGTVDNTTAVVDADSGRAATYFYLGGTFNGSFAGLYDAVRVSHGVLTPDQLLCASGKDACAATGVIATWPLNVTAGTGLGAANLEGGYNLFARDTDFPEGYYLTKTSDGAPNATIPNPDRSRAFDGDSVTCSTNVGSVGFCAGNDHDMGWLATNDKNVLDALKADEGWTLEGWMKFDTTNGAILWTGFGVLVGLAEALDQNSFAYKLQVWNKSGYTGRMLYQQKDPYGALSPEDLPVSSQFKANQWYHLAVVHSYFTDEGGDEPVRMSRMAYYLDGVLQTNVDLVAKASQSAVNWLVFGSNCNGSRGWPGWVNSWRLSRGQLAPGEFLNAAGETPVDPVTATKTQAYWPIDRRDDESLYEDTKAGVSGFVLAAADTNDYVTSVDQARGRVPNSDAVADRTNVGSVTLTNGALHVDYLGKRLDLNAAWTVEGWIKPAADDGGEPRMVAGTYVEANKAAGWKLTLAQGANGPVFGLRAQISTCTPFVQGDFAKDPDSSAVWQPGGWNHVALSFDPFAGRGRWKLYVNGQFYGEKENAWRNLTFAAQTDAFRFGSSNETVQPSLVGGYDMWRVSTGVLEPEDFLYRDPVGLLLLVR